MASNRRLSRRSMVRSLVTVPMSGAMVAYLAACGGPTTATTASSAASQAPTTTAAVASASTPTSAAAATSASAITSTATSVATASTAQTTTALSSAAAAASARPPAAGAVVIEHWTNLPPTVPEQQAREATIEKFNSSQQAVRVTVAPGAADLTKLKTALAGGAPPDSAFIAYFDAAALSAAGAVVDLDQELRTDKDWGTQRQAIFPLAIQTSIWKGKLAAMPFSINNNLIMYNGDVLTKAGVQPPEAGWTWEDFVAAASKAAKPPDVWGLDLGRYGGWAQYTFWANLGGSNGFKLLSDDSTKVQFDSPQAIQITQFHVDLIDKYHLAPNDPKFATELLVSGKTAFEQQGSFRMPLLRQKNVNFGVVANPVAAKGDRRYADGGGHSLAVLRTNNANRTAGAVTFAKYFSSTPAQLQMALTGTMFPISSTALQDKSFQDYLAKDPQYKVYADELPYTGRAPSLPSFQKFTDTLGAALLDAYAGKTTPSDAHASAQPLLQGILDNDLKQG